MGLIGAAALRVSRNLVLVLSSATHSLLPGTHTICFSSVFTKDRRELTDVFTAATDVPGSFFLQAVGRAFCFPHGTPVAVLAPLASPKMS